MKLYRFSPIENQDQLFEAIKYTHLKCFELCKKNFGRHLPVAGNIGIFSHYDDEYEFLTKLRKELTKESDNWNHKYYRLHKPITVPVLDDVPGATYTYLYIRQPDQDKSEVGDVDFVLDETEYFELKDSLLEGKEIKGVKVLDRSDLDLIALSDSDFDVLAFLGTLNIEESIKAQIS